MKWFHSKNPDEAINLDKYNIIFKDFKDEVANPYLISFYNDEEDYIDISFKTCKERDDNYKKILEKLKEEE